MVRQGFQQIRTTGTSNVQGAVTVIVLNACIALLFAVAFFIVRLSYPHARGAPWFVAVYLTGMMTPLSELGVHYFDGSPVFVATSYLSFLMSILGMALALAAVAGRRPPWRAATAILIVGIIARAAIWGGPRNDLGYELVYQSAFAAAACLSMLVAIESARRGGGRLWLAVAITFGFLMAHLLTKPIFAAFLDSGPTAQAYASTNYALFSQATGGTLIITAGLLALLMVVQNAMGETITLSETDPLTGIANRRGFERQSARMFADARRSNSPLAIVLFDLDHFKAINDNYGHAAGDSVIKAFAELLQRTAPPTAAIARLGGEEFVLLLDRTTVHAAWRVAQGIRSALTGVGTHLPAITVSGGIAGMEIGDDPDAMLRRADKWTYTAKQQGRDRICPPPLAVVPDVAGTIGLQIR
jgi:diguanylate cyclase (GGDEF)-like protein